MFGNCGTGIVPVMNVDGNNNGNDMWGGGGWWWAWILIFAMFGWGNGGFGWGNSGNGSNASSFTDAAVQRGFDNQAVMNKLNGLENGICGLGYDQLSQMNGIQNTIQQTGWNLQQTMNQNQIAAMQQAWAAQQQASDCCCENRIGQMNIVNQMDRNSCATNNTINQVGQNLMWSNQQGFRDISDQIAAGFQRIEFQAMQRENADLRQRLNDCNRDNALQETANYIIGSCCPKSQPAYLTCNPNTGSTIPQSALDQFYVYQNRGYYNGYNSGCNTCNGNRNF